MENTYFLLVLLLFTLGIIDLVVGVSNDAVNFLNSAIGSKVANFKTILIVASLGILAGATFSSGMMEVARKGIFVPGFFTFDKIMIIFLAVMLTDIILLDIYNSLGLPTSTTVSIVFELLGAAFIVGFLFSGEKEGNTAVAEYLNFEKSIKIISGIFASIFISFSAGAIVQYLTRVVFSFNFEATFKKFGGIFSGIAISFITYFLLVKGAKGSSFLTADQYDWIKGNAMLINLVSFVFWTIVTYLIMWTTKFHPLKLVVLLGTFSLAMAFAGNDLVNFIGVAVAGFQSYEAWSISGMLPSEFYMDSLGEKVATPTILLLGAGLVMVITLWFSAKAKKVTETEVSLSRQDDGDERFRPNLLSRSIVGGAMAIGRTFGAVTTNDWKNRVGKQFDVNRKVSLKESDPPAFDLLRASVNLMVASVLISWATSMKMPLSTTYVSFMVAMGSSLSDRAWGRESAVYRVAGVLSVIGGWFMTALVAFVTAGIFGAILYYTNVGGVIALTVLAAFMLIKSHVNFKKKSKEDLEDNAAVYGNLDEVAQEARLSTIKSIKRVSHSLSLNIKGLIGENTDILAKNYKDVNKAFKKSRKNNAKLVKLLRQMGDGNEEAGAIVVRVNRLVQDLEETNLKLSTSITEHFSNHHEAPKGEYTNFLMHNEEKYLRFIATIVEQIEKMDFQNFESNMAERKRLTLEIDDQIKKQIEIIQKDEIGNRLGNLQVSILLETKSLLSLTARIFKIYTRYAFRDKIS